VDWSKARVWMQVCRTGRREFMHASHGFGSLEGGQRGQYKVRLMRAAGHRGLISRGLEASPCYTECAHVSASVASHTRSLTHEQRDMKEIQISNLHLLGSLSFRPWQHPGFVEFASGRRASGRLCAVEKCVQTHVCRLTCAARPHGVMMAHSLGEEGVEVPSPMAKGPGNMPPQSWAEGPDGQAGHKCIAWVISNAKL
jgi:hypothetical protein